MKKCLRILGGMNLLLVLVPPYNRANVACLVTGVMCLLVAELN